MERIYLNSTRAAALTGKTEQWIRKIAQGGKLSAETVEGNIGRGGISYRIPLDALPVEAQIRYWEETGAAKMQAIGREEDFDLGAYAKRAGEDGLRTLLERQQAVLQMIGLRESGAEGLQQAREETAKAHGMSRQTTKRSERGSATIYAVAEHAGVSTATVSRCSSLSPVSATQTVPSAPRALTPVGDVLVVPRFKPTPA